MSNQQRFIVWAGAMLVCLGGTSACRRPDENPPAAPAAAVKSSTAPQSPSQPKAASPAAPAQSPGRGEPSEKALIGDIH
jgi:hypothetical protein